MTLRAASAMARANSPSAMLPRTRPRTSGSRWNVEKLHQEADQSDRYHQENFNNRHIDGVRTDYGKPDNQRAEYCGGDFYKLYAEFRHKQADWDKYQVGDEKAHNERIYNIGVLREQSRTRFQPMHHQSAQEDGRDGVARNAKSKRRHKRTSDDGVIGRFRCNDAFFAAGTGKLQDAWKLFLRRRMQ